MSKYKQRVLWFHDNKLRYIVNFDNKPMFRYEDIAKMFVGEVKREWGRGGYSFLLPQTPLTYATKEFIKFQGCDGLMITGDDFHEWLTITLDSDFTLTTTQVRNLAAKADFKYSLRLDKDLRSLYVDYRLKGYRYFPYFARYYRKVTWNVPDF